MINIAVAQSGGPTAAINASFAGILEEAAKQPEVGEIYGFLNGIEGIIHETVIPLKGKLTPDDIELLKLTPSTALGSCRMKLPPVGSDGDVYEKITQVLEKYGIGAFFYIGGNDSMDTVMKLSKYLKEKGKSISVIGIPKTIDNDLKETDHTPGFGSAAKYLAATVKEIACDSQVYALKSVTVIEVMGRDAGWLTASSAVLRANGHDVPHLIYLPERAFDEAKFLEDIRRVQAKDRAVIVAVSEGLRYEDGDYVGSHCKSGAVDTFGHKYLSGLGKYLEELIRNEIGCKVRSIELNVMQRCSSHIASKTDIDESAMIGSEGLRYVLSSHDTGKMMSFRRISDQPYSMKIEAVPVENVANLEKRFPDEWINDEGNQIKDEALPYFLPLIQGEVDTPYKNGIPVHFSFK